MAKKKKTVEINESKAPSKGMLDKLGIRDPEELASQIRHDFDGAEQTKYQWIPERNQNVKDYFGVIQPAEWPFKGASRIKSQFQRIVVDTFSGNVLKSIFMPEFPIKAKPAPLGKDTSDEALANITYVDHLHNSLQENDYHLHTVLDKALPTSLIESFVVLSPVYEYLTHEIIVSVKRFVPKELDVTSLTYDLDTDTVSVKETGELVPSLDMEKKYMNEDELKTTDLQEVQFDVTREECLKDGISIKTINGYRFYMPLGTPGETPYEKVQNAPYVLQQVFYTIREVKQLQEKGYFENAEPVIASAYDKQRELITSTKVDRAGFSLDTAQLDSDYVECLKWCGKWKLDGKWKEITVWMDRNSSQILRAEVNIFGIRPYFPLVPFPIDETPYGESLCQIIRPLVRELDLLLRTITNIALMKSAPPKFFDPSSGFNPSTIGQFGPNSWIPARQPANNILVPPTPEDPQVALQMVQLLISFIERITGINEVVQGQVSDRANTTATEIQQALVRSGVRFDQVYERIKDQLKPMFAYIHKLVLRYMPTEKEIQLMGADNAGRFYKIHKDNLQGRYEFTLAGNSIVSEQNELQNALALYNTLGQHPYLSYKPESIYYVLYNIVNRLNPIAKDKILPTPEEIKQLERERAQVQAQQEQQAAQEAQQSVDMQAQAQMMQMQLEHAQAQQKAQMEDQTHSMDMAQKQEEFNQKMRHNQEMHEQKLKQMREVNNAKAKESRD